jgi:hypothetical protein
MERLLDTSEAAKLLNVCEKTVWNNTAPRGKCIPAVRLGDRLLYSVPALEKWIAEQSESPDDGNCDLAPGWCRMDFDWKQGFPFEIDLGPLMDSLAKREGK